jgi:hypothetical protein
MRWSSASSTRARVMPRSRERDPGQHGRTRTRRTIHLEVASEQGDAFAHARKPEGGLARGRFQIESGPGVMDHKLQSPMDALQRCL